MAVKTFTAGDVLTASDTNTYLANAGLVYISSTTASAGSASVTIANCFSSTYNAYRVVISNMRCTSSAQFVQIQLRVSGTTATTNYYYVSVSAGSSFSITNSAADSYIRTSLVADSTNYSGGTIEIQNPFLTRSTTFQAQGTDPRTSGDFLRLAGGWHNSATSYTDLVLNMGTTDTWNSGLITVYGYRQA